MNPAYWISLRFRRLGTIGSVRQVRTETVARQEHHGGEIAVLQQKMQAWADELATIVRNQEQTL